MCAGIVYIPHRVVRLCLPAKEDWISTIALNPLAAVSVTGGEVVQITFQLEQNYPNPFNPRTIINYELPARSAGGPITNFVELSIYNVLGEKVATLVSQNQTAGKYQVEWDAGGLASGVYFYRLVTARGYESTKKLLLVK